MIKHTQLVKNDPGLCGACRNAQIVRSDRGSIFYLCRRSFSDPRFLKYPRLPVSQCEGFQPGAHQSNPR